jgi:predicted ester cyclase
MNVESEMEASRMLDLARRLAEAKSRQDVATACELLHPDMLLEADAFGAVARGREQNARALTGFFASFPDYRIELEGSASGGCCLVCWGTAEMTMTGTRFGVQPNGKRSRVPVFIRFTFKDDLIASERFFFDLSTLCAQSGVSTDRVRARLFPGEASHARDNHGD